MLEAAEELGYQPNPIARGLKTNRSYTIGVLIPDLTNPLFPPIIRGIEDRLETAGYTPLIANTDNDPRARAHRLEAMRARQVDGFITATARRDHELLDEVCSDRHRRSCSSTGASRTSTPVRSATADDREGVRLAVEHLVALGHTPDRRTSAGPQDLSTGLRPPRGLPRDDARAPASSRTRARAGRPRRSPSARARACASSCIAAGRDFTAVVAGNDLLALGCYDVFAERGRALPGATSRSSASTTCRSRRASTRRSPRFASRITRSARRRRS